MHLIVVMLVGLLLVQSGEKDEAREVLEKLKQQEESAEESLRVFLEDPEAAAALRARFGSRDVRVLSEHVLEGDEASADLLANVWSLDAGPPDRPAPWEETVALAGRPAEQPLPPLSAATIRGLVEALRDPAREPVATTLLRRLGPRVESVLVTCLRSEDAEVISRVGAILGQVGGARALAGIRETIERLERSGAPGGALAEPLREARGAIARRLPELDAMPLTGLYEFLAAEEAEGRLPGLGDGYVVWSWNHGLEYEPVAPYRYHLDQNRRYLVASLDDADRSAARFMIDVDHTRALAAAEEAFAVCASEPFAGVELEFEEFEEFEEFGEPEEAVEEEWEEAESAAEERRGRFPASLDRGETAAERVEPEGGDQSSAEPKQVDVFYATDRAEEVEGAGVTLRSFSWPLGTLVVVALLLALWRWIVRPDWRWIEVWIVRVGALVLLATGFLAVRGCILEGAKADRWEVTYGEERNLDEDLDARVQLGKCRVSVPGLLVRKPGEMPGPGIIEVKEDPRRHIVVLRIDPLAADPFYEEVGSKLGPDGLPRAFVFVHGYNVSFEDAARRTAQLHVDLAFEGAPIFFSWPSRGTTQSYFQDESSVAWAIGHLKQFLSDLRTRTGAELHLIAHSMGNRALTGALRRLAKEMEAGAGEPPFEEVILAAPDLDAETFLSDILPAMRPAARHVTLYGSHSDKALEASKKLHGLPRLGQWVEALRVGGGLDAILVVEEKTLVDTVLGLGHSYYGDVAAVLIDMRAILDDRLRAEQRSRSMGGFLERPAGKSHWELRSKKGADRGG